MGILSWLLGDGRDANAMHSSFMGWLDSQGAQKDSVLFTKYENQELAENPNAVICVGTYEKRGDSESYAFYVEIDKRTAGVVLGRTFFPGGLGTWHKSDSRTALLLGKSLYAVMVDAEKRNHEEFPANRGRTR